jgi:protein transport protein SEC24
MQLGGQPQSQYQQPGQAAAQQPARVGPLNQLYPTDLMNNPLAVSELDLPPPLIVLPPNVSSMDPII